MCYKATRYVILQSYSLCDVLQSYSLCDMLRSYSLCASTKLLAIWCYEATRYVTHYSVQLPPASLSPMLMSVILLWKHTTLSTAGASRAPARISISVTETNIINILQNVICKLHKKEKNGRKAEMKENGKKEESKKNERK